MVSPKSNSSSTSMLLMAISLVLFLTTSTPAGPFYKFSVVAKTGDTVPGTSDLLTGIDRNVSINSNGFVAFVGTRFGPNIDGVDITGENLYAYDSSTGEVRRIMNNAFVLPLSGGTSQVFSPGIQLNDQNMVIARRRMNARVQIGFGFGEILTAPFTYVEKWDATRTELPQQVAMGDAGVGAAAPLLFFLNPATGGVFPSPFVPFTPFSAVYLYPSLNNNGQVAMASKGTFPSGGLNYLTTPVSPPFIYNTFEVTGVTQGSAPRPVIADSGVVASWYQSGSTQKIGLFSPNLVPVTDIASTSDNFTTLGVSPGISDDDLIVVFSGDLNQRGAREYKTNAGSGIFASILDKQTGLRSVIRIAGRSAIEILSNDNDGTSNNDDEVCDAGEICTGELGQDENGNYLFLNSFDLNSRITVLHQELGESGLPDDSFTVCFKASPNGASRNVTQQEGIWAIRIDTKRGADDDVFIEARDFKIKPAQPILQVNDSFRGETINEVAIYDSIAVASTDLNGNPRTPRRGDHQAAFWAKTSDVQMVIRGINIDSDEDGLPDHWEMANGGVDVDEDGVVDLDLNAMGANPNHKDIFLEIDYMEAADHTHRLNYRPDGTLLQSVSKLPLQAIKDAFAAAPVDAGAGITLHTPPIDEPIPEINPIYFLSRGPSSNDDFDDLKYGNPAVPCDGYFGTQTDRFSPNCANILKARSLVFRYAIIGHSLFGSVDTLGKAELPGDDFMLFTGNLENKAERVRVQWNTTFDQEFADLQAYILMHELGHTLSLRHGGVDHINCKPNYLSVMNYTRVYNTVGIPLSTNRPSICVQRPNNILLCRSNPPLDFSRNRLEELNEAQLFEDNGIRGLGGQFTTFGRFGGIPVEGKHRPLIGPSAGAIDWDVDGLIEVNPISSDVNFLIEFGDSCPARPNETLKGDEDWSHLVLNPRCSVNYTVPPGTPTSGDPEPTGEQYLRAVLITVDECASDVSSQVNITRGGFRFNRRTSRYVQSVQLQNISNNSLQGMLSLALHNIGSNVTLFGSAGSTNCAVPSGSPYVNVDVGSDNVLSPGETATVLLEFANPTNQNITYSTRVLSGAGNR